MQEATSLAITRAKENGAEEVTADDLLLGCLKVVSRFGVVEIGPAIVDLEGLGVDWLRAPGQIRGKAAYSQAVVDILDRAALIARHDGAAKVGIEHLLAAFAADECEVMSKLRRQHGISSASWRAAAAGLKRRVEPPQAAVKNVREYLSPEEAAIELGIHVQTLRAYVRSGKLPALRLAGERAIRIRREDLQHLLEPFQPEN